MQLGRNGTTVLALGFGASQADAVAQAEGSLGPPFDKTLADYDKGWKEYDKSLNKPPKKLPGVNGEGHAMRSRTSTT